MSKSAEELGVKVKEDLRVGVTSKNWISSEEAPRVAKPGGVFP